MEKEDVCKCQCQHCGTQKINHGSNGVADVWWEFLQETSFHGCKNIEDRRRGTVYRVVWTLVVLGMLGGLLYTLFQSYVSYHEYKVVAVTKAGIQQSIPFPAVTVCTTTALNDRNNTMSQTLKDYFAGSTLLNFMFPPISANWSEEALRELEETTVHDIIDEFSYSDPKKLINSYRWRGSGKIMFQPVNTYVGKCFTSKNGSAEKVMATTEGRIGSLDLMLQLQEEGGILNSDMTFGAMIFIHDPNEHARTLEGGVMVGPGNAFYINVKPTRYKFLPAPYKSYGNTYCKETKPDYNFEACVMKWSSSLASYHCNCSGLLAEASVQATLSPCSLQQSSTCFDPVIEYFLTQSLMENFTACPRPCSLTTYDTSVSFSKFPSPPGAEMMVQLSKRYGYPNATEDFIRKSMVRVFIYIERFIVQQVEYQPEVTVNGILSQLGGQMGFFLGASLITVFELSEALFKLVWAVGRKFFGGKIIKKVGPEK